MPVLGGDGVDRRGKKYVREVLAQILNIGRLYFSTFLVDYTR
jgi:hypothetical protein